MDISGCMCKFCEDIAFDTTIEDLSIRLETEIGSFRQFISCYILVLEYEKSKMVRLTQLCVTTEFFGKTNESIASYFKRPL